MNLKNTDVMYLILPNICCFSIVTITYYAHILGMKIIFYFYTSKTYVQISGLI